MFFGGTEQNLEFLQHISHNFQDEIPNFMSQKETGKHEPLSREKKKISGDPDKIPMLESKDKDLKIVMLKDWKESIL